MVLCKGCPRCDYVAVDDAAGWHCFSEDLETNLSSELGKEGKLGKLLLIFAIAGEALLLLLVSWVIDFDRSKHTVVNGARVNVAWSSIVTETSAIALIGTISK